MKIIKVIVFCAVLFAIGCSKSEDQGPELAASAVGKVIGEMTEVMIHDVTNPPLGARFYSYACLAGYEVMALNEPAYPSMHGVLNGFPKIEKPEQVNMYNPQVAATLAMLETAQKMQPSGKVSLAAYQAHFLDSLKTVGFSEPILTGSQTYALAISKQILKYAKADKYNIISTFPRYEPKKVKGSWYPTPPGYFPPVEPYFNTVRPFTLDSASQFKPAPPIPYSEEKGSAFFELMQANHDVALDLEERTIAAFWDCNPFALENKGHLMVGMKKISPGAHWMGITNIACLKAGKDFAQTLKISTSVAIGLMDGFMTCWDEKYKSNRIRPETVIRMHLDPHWKPFLQTPPFPEYLSGHSVVSSAAATILTHYFGDNFEYLDTVEERFGLKARHFKSFNAAAEESGMSRFYGGIHFMDAIENGQTQGHSVGKWVISKLDRAQ